MTDASLEIISGFDDLRELNLYRSRVTNAGLAHLAKLKKLRLVDLRYSNVTSAGVQTLREALPNTKIVYFDSSPANVSENLDGPANDTEPAIATWIRALGGEVTVANGSVEKVSLARQRFTDAQTVELGKLTSLRQLDLEATDVSDLGLKEVATFPRWKS